MLRDKDSGTFVPVVAKVRHGTAEQQEEVAISHTIVDEVALHKRSILSFDALDDTRFNRTNLGGRPLHPQHDVRAAPGQR